MWLTWAIADREHFHCLCRNLAFHQRSRRHLAVITSAMHHLHFNSQLVAWHHGTAELGVLDSGKVDELIAFKLVRHLTVKQDAPHLCHGFQNEHSWHHGRARKMPLKELLVHGEVLQTHDAVWRLHLHNPVHEKERISVWKELHDFRDAVHNAVFYGGAGYRVTHL